MAKIPTKKKFYRQYLGSISSILFFIANFQGTLTSPVIRSSRMVREIYPEVEQAIQDSSQIQVCIVGDVVYGAGESVPSEQPCLKCACTPPDVRCETEICVQQPGCKAIHRPNKCCPDYMCECQHKGKRYGNGERLPTAPGGECLVCYCRGGEVQCAEVGCYTRNDCEPRYVSRQCCPKYDHCPPRDPLSHRGQYTTESILSNVDPELMSFWPLTGVPENASALETSSQSINQELNQEGSGDIDASIFSAEFLSSSVTPSQAPIAIHSYEPNARPSTPITFSIKEIESKTNQKRNEVKVKIITKIDKSTQTDSDGRPQITIQEVIPERTEYKITSAPQKDVVAKAVSVSPINPVTYRNQYQEQLISTSSPKKILSDTSNDLSDSESDASEKTEVYDRPPPVLRIGEKLLFIKQGQLIPRKDASTPTPVITLIGAEGLQIGLGSGELLEHEIIPINNYDSTDSTVETLLYASPAKKRLAESDLSQETLTKKFENLTPKIIKEGSAIERTTAASFTKLEIVSSEDISELKTSKPRDITLDIFEPNDTSNEFITIYSAEKDKNDSQNSEIITENVTNNLKLANLVTTLAPEKTTNIQINSSASNLNSLIHKTENSEYIPEENPYYPPIPEDIMVLNQDESTTELSVAGPLKNQNNHPTIRVSVSENNDNKSKNNLDLLVTPLSTNTPVNIQQSHVIIKIPAYLQKELFIRNTENVNKRLSDSKDEKEEDNSKILPEILVKIDNKTMTTNKTESSQTWLKQSSTKISIPLTKDENYYIPLLNVNAALPDSVLEMTAASDLSTEDDSNISDRTTAPPFLNTSVENLENKTEKPTESLIKEIFALIKEKEVTIKSHENVEESKSNKIIAVPKKTIDENDGTKSKDMIELNDETFDSDEVTTSKDLPGSLMSNEDASVETIQNNSNVDSSDLVEMLPGYERTTQKNIVVKEIIEEHLKNIENNSPKHDVEMITENEDKMVFEDSSPVEIKDFHEEIQKRDVVKKVLTDTFDNPKENIRIELVENTTNSPTDYHNSNYNEEQNIVKPINDHNLSTRNLNTNSSVMQIDTDYQTNLNKTLQELTITDNQTDKKTNVIQKITNDNSKANLQQTTENVDPEALGSLRDFINNQYRLTD